MVLCDYYHYGDGCGNGARRTTWSLHFHAHCGKVHRFAILSFAFLGFHLPISIGVLGFYGLHSGAGVYSWGFRFGFWVPNWGFWLLISLCSRWGHWGLSPRWSGTFRDCPEGMAPPHPLPQEQARQSGVRYVTSMPKTAQFIVFVRFPRGGNYSSLVVSCNSAATPL